MLKSATPTQIKKSECACIWYYFPSSYQWGASGNQHTNWFPNSNQQTILRHSQALFSGSVSLPAGGIHVQKSGCWFHALLSLFPSSLALPFGGIHFQKSCVVEHVCLHAPWFALREIHLQASWICGYWNIKSNYVIQWLKRSPTNTSKSRNH